MNPNEIKSAGTAGQNNNTQIQEPKPQESNGSESVEGNVALTSKIPEKESSAVNTADNTVNEMVHPIEPHTVGDTATPSAGKTEVKKKKPTGNSKKILIALILLFASILIFAVAELLHMYIGYASARREYSEINETYVDTVPDIVFAPPDSSALVYSELSPVSVDFAGLKAACPDIQGWLYSEGTIISYPVVQCDDNETYLHNAMDGSYSYGGTLFVDCICQPEFQGKNTIIYGHNMNDGSMFASLISYRDQNYYEEHPIMYLNTPDQNYKVIVFAGYTTPADSDTYTYSFADDAAFEAYVEKMAEQSDFDSGVLPGTNDRIITLSTCAYDYDEARYVIQGVLMPVG